MTQRLSEALAAALGSPVSERRALSGGDINDAFAVTLTSGEQLFVKTRTDAPIGMYAREAEGLSWLAEAQALPTPRVRLVHDDFLVLELVLPSARRRDFDESLGRGLALLHAFGAASFGWQRDNFIANLPQDNRERESFHEFYRVCRLEPLRQRAHAAGLLDRTDMAAFERLYGKLELLIPREPPARLHGDLWSGNVFVDASGAPMLIDPAVYGGAREIDLAMLQLFGAPSSRLFAAYEEVSALEKGWRERVGLWQLYPLLVHVCLFGGSYRTQLRTALNPYL